MAQFVVTLVDPSQFNGIERTLVDTSFVKGLSERNGVAYIAVKTVDEAVHTLAVFETFDEISHLMIQASRGYI